MYDSIKKVKKNKNYNDKNNKKSIFFQINIGFNDLKLCTDKLSFTLIAFF